jgi:hypothetical protein
MAETITVGLGGREFVVGALTFRQLRSIEEALAKAATHAATGAIGFDAAIDILVAAIERAHPGMDREAILDLEGTKAQIVAATRAVLSLSGYVEREVTPGEHQAGN